MAWVSPKPLEIGLLLNRSWFTPLTDVAPPAKMTRRQAVAASLEFAVQRQASRVLRAHA